MGRMFRRWAVCFVDGLYVSSMGCMFRRWAVRFDDGRYLSLLDATCRRQVVCVIDGLWGGRLGTLLGCKAVSYWGRVSTRSVGGGWSTVVGIRRVVRYGGLGYSG